jgi:molybdopterin-containing oxidoreductase family iron-sulfur binding subunit
MKTLPPPCPEPETGPKYWRSLEQLADTPEFREWVEREFPAGASEFTDPVSRRHFVQIMWASFLLAGLGLTGCRRPEHKILPYSKQPGDYIHGVAQYYATAMPTRLGAIPLLARSSDGRPTKVEGNPGHPLNRFRDREGKPHRHGATDHFAQASVLSLYDPDRATRFARGRDDLSREQALDFLRQLSARFTANAGKGLAVLMQRNTSPSRARLVTALSQKFPQARWFIHEPVDLAAPQQAATLACGQPVALYYRLDQARVILSLDADFIAGEDASLYFSRDFIRGRRTAKPGDEMNRLYVVEGLMSLTGAQADHRLRLPPGAVVQVAARLAEKVLGAAGGELVAALQRAGPLDPKTAEWVDKCADDLRRSEHQGKGLVLAGHRQPLAVHLAAYALNNALGSLGSTVTYLETPADNAGSIADLAKLLQAGAVDTLVILGANPVYDAPADLDWEPTQRKARTVVRLGMSEDETGVLCDYHFPAAHYLESWGDARLWDGSLVSIQPLIEPLFGGLTELEMLALLGGLDPTRPYDIVRETFRGFAPKDFEERWKRFLHDGFLPDSAAKPAPAQFDLKKAVQALEVSPVAAPSPERLEVVFHRDYSVDDGRWNNNGWLQEFPDPITKVTWDNVITVSPKTAAALGLEVKDNQSGRAVSPVVRIELAGRSVEGAVWVQPGQADFTLGLALGYGRPRSGRVGHGTGYNAYRLRATTALQIASGAKLTATGRMHPISSAQSHWAMEGRPIIREANLAQYRQRPDFAGALNLPHPPDAGPLYPNPLDEAKQAAHHHWGMAIDLSACVGCSACVLACQSENNVPIVGKEQVGKSREMHWLRVDRYYAGSPEDPQVAVQPMMCQHCEAAPCESVCPVNATVHDAEGLNLMVYNRCVGTRYCSNNCPYKVRRFNFFDYHKRPLDQLYKTPLLARTDGEWELTRWFKNPSKGYRPEDEWNLVQLARNPDVSVRMRGVMEKCTFCIQRIESAKIAQKIKARDSAAVVVPDGAFTTACAQACPTEAIVFGNLRNPESRVSQLRQHERNYSVLEFLNTKPRLTYLARLRNPNPAMPDYQEMPLTLREYSDHHGDPLKGAGGGHATPSRPEPKAGGH